MSPYYVSLEKGSGPGPSAQIENLRHEFDPVFHRFSAPGVGTKRGG